MSTEERPPRFGGMAFRYAHLYRAHRFAVAGAMLSVVSPPGPPRRTAAGFAWVWRAEFLGAFDRADRELLDAGWHLVHVAVPDRFGDPVAIEVWEAAHRLLVDQHGFADRPGLIALSRGGLYAMAWAAAHPDRTLAVYLDNAVCDLRSWPGGAPQGLGRGAGAEAEWATVCAVYGTDDPDRLAAVSPLAVLPAIAAAGIPLLVVYGDRDTVVPAEENSVPLVARYRDLGGPVEEIRIPGRDHHPHGFDDESVHDPAQIREFFETARTRATPDAGPTP